jgi:acyl carrier protein
MDKLELFNAIVKQARPASTEEIKANSLDDTYADIGLDSLDTIMLLIYFAEVYGVPEEIAKELQPKTVGECFVLYEKHATKNPETIQEAIKNMSF